MRHPRRSLGLVMMLACTVAACRTDPPTPTAPPPTSLPDPSTSIASPDPASASVTPVEPVAWTRIEPSGPRPSGREGHSWTVDPASAVAYLFGGRTADGPSDEVWAYDLTADVWSALTPDGAGPSPRWGHVAQWLDGIGLVIFGGAGAAATGNDLWAYDPDADAWRILGTSGRVPSARVGACATVDPAGGLWVTHGEGPDGTLLSDTWRYDPAASTWAGLPATSERPSARAQSACWWSAEDGFTLAGGRSATDPALTDTWLTGPAADRGWSPGPAFAAPGRHGAALVASASAVYLMGGQGGAGLLDDLVVSDTSSGELDRFEPDGDGPSARVGAALVDDPQGERLVLFGGRVEAGPDAKLWSVASP